MTDKDGGQWNFYAQALRIGAVVVVGGILFLLARTGDAAAIALLAALVTLSLLGLGLYAAVLLLDKQAAAEQRRFQSNIKENLVYMEQQQRVLNAQLQAQGRQAQSLLRQTEQYSRLLPKPGAQPVDVDAVLTWDVQEVEGDGW